MPNRQFETSLDIRGDTLTFTANTGLALIRIGVGFYFLTQAWIKTVAENWLQRGDSMAGSIREDLPSSVGLYRPFLEEVVLTNATLFSQLVVVGEWAVGLSMLFGAFSRLGALVGMCLMMNFTLMQGVGNAVTSSNLPILLTFIACAVVGAGASWGLDGWLARSTQHMPIIRWFTGVHKSKNDLPMRTLRENDSQDLAEG